MAACLLVLVASYAVITAWNIHLQTIAAPDEPRYAAAARDMIRTGDWVIPYFNGKERLVKPIFFYWLIAALGAAGSKFGVPLDTAFRFGPMLMGLLTVSATFLLGRRLRSQRYAFVAAVMLMTTIEFHKLARELVVDMTLTAFLLWAWLFFHVALERIEKQSQALFPLLGFYVCLGLACLTKGPFLVAIFVVIPLVAYLYFTKRLPILLRAGAWWGAPLALFIGLSWWGLVEKHGFDAMQFFMNENLKRFSGAKDHTQNPVPYIFYFKALAEGLPPWVVLIPVAAWWSFRSLRAPASEATETTQVPAARNRWNASDSAKFLTCCLAIPFIIMGISVSKRPLYILPIYPFLALWVAWMVDAAFLSQEGTTFCTRCANALGIGVLILCAIGIVVAFRKLPKWGGYPSEVYAAAAVLFVLGAAGWAASQNLKLGYRYAAVLQILAMAAALTIGYEAIETPIWEREKDSKHFFSAVHERLDNHPFFVFEESFNEAVWYLDQKFELVRRPDLKEHFFDKTDMPMLAPLKRLKLYDPDLLKSLRMLGEPIPRGKQTYVVAEPDPAIPPNPSVFVPRSRRGEEPLGDD